MRKQFYALICVAIALLLLFGCSVEERMNGEIKKWARNAGEPLRHSVEYLPRQPEDSLTGGTIQVCFYVYPTNVVKITQNIRNSYIHFINSLVEVAVARRYLNFKMKLIFDPLGGEREEFAEVDENGIFKNKTFLRQGATAEELEKAKENYSKYSLKDFNTCEFRFRNENEKIPLYVYDLGLTHNRGGALHDSLLRKGEDFEGPDPPSGILEPGYSGNKYWPKTFRFRVDSLYTEYGSLHCLCEVEIAWLKQVPE